MAVSAEAIVPAALAGAAVSGVDIVVLVEAAVALETAVSRVSWAVAVGVPTVLARVAVGALTAPASAATALAFGVDAAAAAPSSEALQQAATRTTAGAIRGTCILEGVMQRRAPLGVDRVGPNRKPIHQKDS